MKTTEYPITRDELVGLISRAAADLDPHLATPLVQVAHTAKRVAVGNFSYVNGCACPWTLAGLPMDAAVRPGRFASRFDGLADEFVLDGVPSTRIPSFYNLVVKDA